MASASAPVARPTAAPSDPDRALVKITYGPGDPRDDTYPPYCDTPRVLVNNQSNRYLSSITVRFSTLVTDYSDVAATGSSSVKWGPVLTATRVIQIPPMGQYRVAVKLCGKASDLPVPPPNPPGTYLASPILLVQNIVGSDFTFS